MFEPVKPDVNFPSLEEKQLAFWDQNKIFEKSVSNSEHAKPYSFYDGPPFATGLPHYGHLLAGTLKDIVPRYWTMKGYSVKRRFGWDCHGIPVEFEINKTLNLHSRVDVINFGVDKYNAACRGIVDRYTSEWKKTVRRMGRWVDMENAYFTMQVEFMQSVWWVFQQLFNKGLIYEGLKVVPYSTGISTPLSNFEANQDYREVQDPAVTVTFPLSVESGKKLGITDGSLASVLAWTTTPWTLPSNLGLAVHRDIDYVLVKEASSGKYLILAEARLSAYSKKPAEDFSVINKFKGSDLIGLEYTELFPFFSSKRTEGAFKVIHSDHVTVESGTGVVHMAPAFGEEDFYAMKAANMPIVNPVDDDGVFTSEVPDFKGVKVKEADKGLIAKLKESGRLYKQDTLVHSYPFCYRSGTPLIYRAVPSWFVAVEKIKDQLIANNKTTAWIPETLRDGRFGNWLENARDWAVSRNRFWGTPLPIWKSKDGKLLCVGSRDELEKLSGVKVPDLHKEFVDKIVINKDGVEYRRIDSVLDCWFESGSMPYAQWGYPFKHEEEFKRNFPADFIAEGLDQTRGWFYTLMVIGTGLFGKSPFKNVIVNGMILAEDGKKMSKSLKNYPDPSAVIQEHGADAIRLYMIDSPAVKAEELRFAEKGVREIVRRILLRWWNAYSFFTTYASVDGFKPRGDYAKSPNLLDQWILSKTHSLIQKTNEEMAAYRLYTVVPELLNFIESLTNTYIRFNRPHFWKSGMPEDKRYAYETLYYVLTTLSKVMAPFAPFLSEETYRNLSRALPDAKESVHLEMFPEAERELINPSLEQAVARMDALVMMGRNLREKIKIKAKIPLKHMKIIHRDRAALDALKQLETYFQDELNIRKFEYVTDEENYVTVKAKANFPVLGKRVGPKMKAIAGKIAQFSTADLEKLESGASITIDGESITLSDVEITRSASGNNPNISAHQLVSIEVDPSLSDEQILEGLSREVMRKIQQARKNADLKLDARISLTLYLEGKLLDAAKAHEGTLKSETLATKVEYVASEDALKGTHRELATDVEEGKIGVGLTVV